MKRLYDVLLGLSLCLYSHWISGQTNQSVLATGDWYKIGITKPGIYKLDGVFLKKAGISLTSLNPLQIKIYGNGGGMLPQANQCKRPDDLVENAIWIKGETDGHFDNDDFILFYAEGPHQVSLDTTTNLFQHHINIYSDTAYYFLTIGTDAGKRVPNTASVSGDSHRIQSFDDYQFHEKEQTNLIQSGRQWYGEKFDVTTEQTFDFPFPGLLAGSPVHVTSAVMAQAPALTRFQLQLNGQPLGTQSVESISSGTYDVKGRDAINTFTTNQPSIGSPVRLTIMYDKAGVSTGVGYVNWLGLQAKRELKLYGNQTIFRSIESLAHDRVSFVLADAPNNLQIWDITDPLRAKNQLYTQSGNQTIFTTTGDTLKTYVAFAGTTFDAPASVQKLSNQNLHSLASPQLLIISPASFLNAAHQLADLRRSHDGLSAEVVVLNQIYNEFSSGQQDITAIRDFIRFLYKKDNRLQYVLLFGDASYDYKNRLGTNTSRVPTYESVQSLHPIFSYSSDDYYGFMDENEGEWLETSQGDHQLDVSIGRLPVNSVKEAEGVVAKLTSYAQNPKSLGKWRNQICFVADDGDVNTHQQDAERLTESLSKRYPTLTIDKIYVDAYPQISSPGGQQAPEVREAINTAMDRGNLIMNYTGHGAEIGWAQEQILTIPQINAWNNLQNMPLLVTATCEFGRYDDPSRTSGAEFAVLNPKGGAIGLITTTRPVFSNTNFALNVAFYNAIFEPINGQMPRLGDAMKATKNNSLNGSINRNFSLLGDPSMRLAYPQEQVVLTKINGKSVDISVDTLKALSTITLEGEIRNHDGTLQEDFTGTLQNSVFDKQTQYNTLGNESSKMTFGLQNNKLFEGKASVKNGRFIIRFIVPKDMDYRLGAGRISFYAQTTQGLRDATGAFSSFAIGGSMANPPLDTTPPHIRLFMDDTTFVNGSITGSTTTLLAKLSDESGINTSQTGIGHEIMATLDGQPEKKFILNDFYTAATDDFKQGEVRFPIRDLPEGKYHLNFKAWDTYNNSSTAELIFRVVSSKQLVLEQIMAFPNPFRTNTTFHFTHNRAGEELAVEIQIFTLTGQKVKTINSQVIDSPGSLQELSWDGTTDAGVNLSPGVYVYKLIVRCITDNATTYSVNRVILLR